MYWIKKHIVTTHIHVPTSIRETKMHSSYVVLRMSDNDMTTIVIQSNLLNEYLKGYTKTVPLIGGACYQYWLKKCTGNRD